MEGEARPEEVSETSLMRFAFEGNKKVALCYEPPFYFLCVIDTTIPRWEFYV